MRFIFNLSDRVACLVQGEKLVEGTSEVVQGDERVIAAYLGTPFEGAPGAEELAEVEAAEAAEATAVPEPAEASEAPESDETPEAPETPEAAESDAAAEGTTSKEGNAQ
jgi:branched-chain amino acid transport system ATP-binding protein